MKFLKKIRFRRSDADRAEEFGGFEAIVCDMMRSRSAEGRLLHREVGTRSAERGLLGRAEATRRAQRRLTDGAEATNSAKERVDNDSDFTTARIVIKSDDNNLFNTRKGIKL